MQKKKRMLVIYASAGGGHYSAARAIEKAMNEKYPGYEIVLLDGPKISGSKLINFFNDIYNILLKVNIKFCIYGFWILNLSRGDKSLVNLFPSIIKRAAKHFREINPDIIVSVNSGVNAFVTEIYKRNDWEDKIPFIIVVTDPTNGFVRGWSHPDVDMMVAPLEECRQQLIEYGMPQEKIKVLKGVPVNPDFMKDQRSKEDAREVLGLDKNKFTVLATSGGVGTRDLGIFAKDLAKSGLDIQLLVCCGKNEEQQKDLAEFSKTVSIPMTVVGFTEQMHTLMDACDIVVGKPGPGIIAEAAVKLKPLVLETLSGVMHQEKGNLDYSLNKGIALQADTKAEVIEKVKFLMNNPAKYDEMVENMRKIDNASAIYNLVDMIMTYSDVEFYEEKSRAYRKSGGLNNYHRENPGYSFDKARPQPGY